MKMVEEVENTSLDKNSSDNNKASDSAQTPEQPPKEKKIRKYKFECTKCGLCCEQRSHVPLTFQDIELWMKKGTINVVLPYIEVGMIEIGEPDKTLPALFLLATQKPEEESKSQACPMYDKENKICNIYFAMPSDCDAYPLGYNGSKFVLKDKSCEGLGKGKMTKEKLAKEREKAKSDFEAKVKTSLVFPILYNTFMKSMLQQQQKMMETLSPDQKEKLDEILGTRGPKEGESSVPPSENE